MSFDRKEYMKKWREDHAEYHKKWNNNKYIPGV